MKKESKEEPLLVEFSEEEMKEKILGWAAKAMAEWMNDNKSEEQVKRAIHDRLNRERDNVIFGILGFRMDWGKVEIDRTNGREGPAAAFLKGKVEKHVKEWLEGSLSELPDPSPQIRKAIKQYVGDRLNWEVEKVVKEIVIKKAEQIGSELLGENFNSKHGRNW